MDQVIASLNKSVSHQLFGTADRHLEIRLAGVNNLAAHPEYYIEFSSHESWLDYLRMMSKLGSWCDHITIQAVADVFNCTIDITESAFGFDETTLIRPRAVQPQTRLIHIGHLDEMHYVPTIPLAQINCSNKEKQKIKRQQQYLRRKASETKEQRDKRLAQGNKYRQKMKNSNPGKNQTIKRWYVQLCIEDSTNRANTFHVTLYHTMVARLIELADVDVDLSYCDEEELTVALLESPQLAFFYDTAYKVTDIKLIDV